MIDMAIPFPELSPFVFQLPMFDLFGFALGPFGLRWYALAYVAGLILGWRLMVGMVKKPGRKWPSRMSARAGSGCTWKVCGSG
eukprot:gene11355-biopygen9526